MGRKDRSTYESFSDENALTTDGLVGKDRPEPAVVQRASDKLVIDVRRAGHQIAEGVFRLKRYIDGPDYVDTLNSRRIGSIGRNVHDGRIEAAVDARYYGNPNWECLFMR